MSWLEMDRAAWEALESANLSAYQIRALLCLLRAELGGDGRTALEIQQATGIPYHRLRNSLRALSQTGFVVWEGGCYWPTNPATWHCDGGEA